MSKINKHAESQCSNCGVKLTTFAWGKIFNVCCINTLCKLFRHPIRQSSEEQNIKQPHQEQDVLCHNCGYTKPITSMVMRDRYRICDICAQQYEQAKCDGKVTSIEDFVLDNEFI
ncbi:MAG: hypothetical protein PHI59_06965 [Candidatus Omnitrophica bacterium]|nr:hypothetical protein [Candidatus Omnitrophota bacterium]